jgi:MFS family permease
MVSTIARISTLLLGMGILLGGNGLLGTLLGVRAGVEGFTDTATGGVMSAYFLAFIFGTFVCPPVIRRVGHIRAFAAMGAVASAVAIAHVLLVNPWVWGVLRAVNGISMVGLFMVMESWLNALAPNERRGRIFAAYTTVNLVAMAAGQSLLATSNVSGFTLFGLVAILYSLALVPVALTNVREPAPVDVPHLHLRGLYSVSPLGFVGTMVAGLSQGAFWGMGAVFAHGIGMSASGVAAFMTATIIGGALLQWPIGRLSDRYDRRIVLVFVCFAAAACALVAFRVANLSSPALLASTFLYGGFAFSVYSLTVSHVNDHLQPVQVLGATSGLLLIYGIGAAAAPAVIGVLMEALGPRSLLTYFAATQLSLALFGIYRMWVRAAVPAEAQGAFVPMVRTSQVALEMDPRAEVEPEPKLK